MGRRGAGRRATGRGAGTFRWLPVGPGPAALVLVLGLVGAAGGPARPARAAPGIDGTVLTVQAPYLRRALDRGERVILIDVRSPGDHAAARLPGARSIPLAEIQARHAEVPAAGLVVLYGPGAAGPLQETYLYLRSLGYRNLAVLEDGFAGWAARGFPMEGP
jgi:rhodanese-related sulfurtransferase